MVKMSSTTSRTPAPSWFHAEWLELLLALGTLLLYVQVAGFEFINYDDNLFVYKNEHVLAGLTWSGIQWAFTSADIDYWRPLSWLSHMLDVQLFGLRAGAHHLTSAGLHALNAALLLLALNRLTQRLAESAVVAALFALHPLHVESVAWVGERKDVLCASFWFLGLWRYAGHAASPSRRTWWAVTLCLALGLMSKPMILTFPFLLLVLDVWPLRRLNLGANQTLAGFGRELGPLMKEKAAWFGLIVLAAASTYVAQDHVGAIMADERQPLVARILNVPVAYVRYLALTFWPDDLAILYPLPKSWPLLVVIGAVILLAVLTWFAWRRRAEEPWLLVGWAWFLGTLVPVIGLVQVGEQAIANRYTYVPLIGLFVALVWGWVTLAGRLPWLASKGSFIASLALVLCAFRTHSELAHWQNGITIFEQAVRVTRDNFVAFTNLGNSLANSGQRERALQLYQSSLAILPTHAKTHYNMACVLVELGRLAEAETHYRTALQSSPDYADAHNNFANLLSDTGRGSEAIGHYEASLRFNPRQILARYNYGLLLAESGKPTEAAAQFELILRDHPAFSRARVQLINLLAGANQLEAAFAQNAELLRHDSRSPEGHVNAGNFAAARGDWPNALQLWRTALQLRPDFPFALQRLAWTLATHPNSALRQPAEALAFAKQVTAQSPSPTAETQELLAVAHAANGNFAEAKKLLQQALSTVPANAPYAAQLRAELARFENGQPWIDPPPK